ncbi:MAG: hypothetical protein M1365_00890 [Actinobacteria bacterium]|nr:hypothetical protein [Actinomycetota bacterium]
MLLEITPPAFTEKTAYTTQQLFSVFHDLGYKTNFFNSLLGRKTIFSLEIVSNRTQGIRYIIRSSKEEADILRRDLLSYLPDVKVKEVEEYLPKDLTQAKVIEWKLKNHFAFPLKKQNTLSEHDPVAYITGAMTKLEPTELISFQIVLSPTLRHETNILSNKILHNEDVLGYINRPHFAWYIQVFYVIFKLLFNLTNKALMELAWAISEISHGSSKTQPSYSYAYQQNIKVPNARPARILSSFEQQAVLSIQEKIDQKLFEAKIRALVVINDKSNQRQRIKGL